MHSYHNKRHHSFCKKWNFLNDSNIWFSQDPLHYKWIHKFFFTINTLESGDRTEQSGPKPNNRWLDHWAKK